MPRIVMQPSGKSVDCASGDTVLMALKSRLRPAQQLPRRCLRRMQGQGQRRPF